MISAVFLMAALMGSDVTTPIANAASAMSSPKVDRFAGRPQARIPFAREVRNFQVKRDGYDDILYLETSRDRWYRSEITCMGIFDPRDAQGLVPRDHGFGIDNFSRVDLVGFGSQSTQCYLNGLVELTPEEAVEFRLLRRHAPLRAPAQTNAPVTAPAS